LSNTSSSLNNQLAPVLMFQGTGSSVGKSLLVAAFCRLLKDKGFSVAPYKSQNMSLNSAICAEGTEISRAQAMQAEAAKTPALADMNPILLKPSSDSKAQLIVNGNVIGNFTANQYHKMKLSLLNNCLESLQKLRVKNHVVIIEGAGSPAEINLADKDIANMKIAQSVDSPVIIIGDIDKGGVFASLYGTYMLLPEIERKRIAGFIINKFRGDKSLLKSGIDFIERKTNVPVLGVLPFSEIELDAEDSASLIKQTHGEIDIAVIRLPKISNFTDFWPLQKENNVGVRYVTTPGQAACADIIILPGSKSVISDLLWLKQTGLSKIIAEKAKTGSFITGICGGFQMLGNVIEDEAAIEASQKIIEGLGLLDIATTFKASKITRNTKAVFNANSNFKDLKGIKVTGYEIHNGVSTSDHVGCFTSSDGSLLGQMKNNVFGTYLHGIFNNDNFRTAYINIVRRAKGLSSLNTSCNFKEFKESQYDKLAALTEENLDMETIYKILFNDQKVKKQPAGQCGAVL
jgi:adenosylcobyric acid synthase